MTGYKADMSLRHHARTISVDSPGRGTVDITSEVQQTIADADVHAGVCTVFCHHTSASLIICENADPTVRSDLERFAERLVPDGDPLFQHTAEGPDDMPAHVRSILTQASLSIPVSRARADLGTWQGVYLWEHRTSRHRRRVTISVIGG